MLPPSLLGLLTHPVPELRAGSAGVDRAGSGLAATNLVRANAPAETGSGQARSCHATGR